MLQHVWSGTTTKSGRAWLSWLAGMIMLRLWVMILWLVVVTKMQLKIYEGISSLTFQKKSSLLASMPQIKNFVHKVEQFLRFSQN